jgi:hypothetical protein
LNSSNGSCTLEYTRGNAAVSHLHASQPQISSRYSIERKELTSIADFISLLCRLSLSINAGCKNPAFVFSLSSLSHSSYLALTEGKNVSRAHHSRPRLVESEATCEERKEGNVNEKNEEMRERK